jgi:hypothetical protein
MPGQIGKKKMKGSDLQIEPREGKFRLAPVNGLCDIGVGIVYSTAVWLSTLARSSEYCWR